MRRWLKLDAQNRWWRTWLQFFVAIVLVPALDAGLQVAQRQMLGMFQGDPFDWQRTGIAIGFGAVYGAVVSLLAYLHRAKLDPSWVPSAQPPRPVGVTEMQAPATAPAAPVGK